MKKEVYSSVGFVGHNVANCTGARSGNEIPWCTYFDKSGHQQRSYCKKDREERLAKTCQYFGKIGHIEDYCCTKKKCAEVQKRKG